MEISQAQYGDMISVLESIGDEGYDVGYEDGLTDCYHESANPSSRRKYVGLTEICESLGVELEDYSMYMDGDD